MPTYTIVLPRVAQIAAACRHTPQARTAVIRHNLCLNAYADSHEGNGNRAARRMGVIPEKRYPVSVATAKARHQARCQFV